MPFIALIVTLMLIGCGDFDSVSKASEIIKKELRSPSSFRLASGKEVWTGKNKESKPAHIVRIEYDAQNGFGAMIRDCKLVAYIDNGDKFSWSKSGAIDECKTQLFFNEIQAIERMRKFNFE